MFFLPCFFLKKFDNTIPTYTTHKHINLIEISNIYKKVNEDDNELNSEAINSEEPVEENGIEAEKTVENTEDDDVEKTEDIAGIVNMQLEEKSSIDEDSKIPNDAVEDVDNEESDEDEDEDEKSQEISDNNSEQVIEESKDTNKVNSAGAEEKDENITVSTEIDDDKEDAAEDETEIDTTNTETQAQDIHTKSDNIETEESENHDENDNDIVDVNIEGVDKEVIDEKEHEEIIEEV